MGLIRKTIVLGGIIAAIPAAPTQMQVAGSDAPSTFATISAATDTVSDVKGFCARQPRACAVGQYIAGSLEAKARYSAKLISEWANSSKKPAQGKGKIKSQAPPLRLATMTDDRPQTINDLLRGSLDTDIQK